MNTRTRHFHVDIIKTIATIVIILTHVLAYHLGNYSAWWLWNYIHFVVVGLVFASAYLYADAHLGKTAHLSLRWFAKRISRLYIPFFIYLIVHRTLIWLFPEWLIGYGWKKTTDFFLESALLIGGVDFGWLTTLFIQLAILSPFLLVIARSKKKYIALYMLTGFALVTTFVRIPSIYTRIISWLPWSLIAMLGFVYRDLEVSHPNTARTLAHTVFYISVLAYIALFLLVSFIGMPTSFNMHKYPPDLLYLSYGIAFTAFFIRLTTKYGYILSPVSRYISFISKQSYEIFFIHFILLDLIMTSFRSTWIMESTMVISGTLMCSWILHTGRTLWKRYYVS